MNNRKTIAEIKNKIEYPGMIIISMLLSFGCLIKSPLHPWNRSIAFGDSAVFKTVSFMIRRGYVPYKDTFDHKGPLLYLFNLFGDYIDPIYGVWVIEWICLTVFIIFVYLEAKLMLNKKQAILTVFFSIVPFVVFFEGGNLTEEYSLPFVGIACFIFFDYFLNSKISGLRLIVCGFGMGMVLLLRPNLIAPWIALCFMVFIFALIEKKCSYLLGYTLWFFLGVVLAIFPFFIYLWKNGALREFWNVYIVFNMMYTDARSNVYGKMATFFDFLKEPTYALAMCAMVCVMIYDRKKADYAALLLSGTMLIFLSMGGGARSSYALAVVPTVVYPIMRMLEECNNNGKTMIVVISTFILAIYIFPIWMPNISENIRAIPRRNDEKKNEQIMEIVSLIDDNTSEDEKITVYGNDCIFYVLSNRVHASKYSYQVPIGEIDPNIMDNYFVELWEEKPTLVLAYDFMPMERMEDYLEMNGYYLLSEYSIQGYGLKIYKIS